ncbi:Efflux transporter, RND family, MFP subunit, AcrA/E family [hydrothermal vent metagenome]|uniref:Efflux transporter, RND family, MFP subunit, AcrA/E family n=1 Tax=hydrothermal vent metagenome TaxID=652676 RepID=A0A3B1ASC1_9ZZZZ
MNKQLVKQITIILLTVSSFVVVASPYYNNMQMPMSQPSGMQNQIQVNNPYGNGNRAGIPYSPQPQIISVMAAPTGSSVVLGGTVVPLREVTLSAQIPGRVDYLAGVEGESFQAGEVVVAIDDDDLLAKRQQALANITAQQQALQNSRVQYSKEFWAPRSRDVGRMPGMGLPSMFDMFFTRPMASGMGYGNPILERQADLYAQGTHVGQARSQHISALSELQQVDAKLRDSRTVVPFDAIIVKRLVEVGQTVQPGQPLLKLADSHALQLKVEVPVRLVSGLRQEMMVPVILDVGNTQIRAQVAQIYPVADNNRHTVTVKFDLPDGIPGGPGMYAEVMIPDPSIPVQNLPIIPNSAVIWRGSLPAVFVVNYQNKKELRLIRLGEAIDKWTVAVLSGLRAGERIFAQPSPGMSAGWVK